MQISSGLCRGPSRGHPCCAGIVDRVEASRHLSPPVWQGRDIPVRRLMPTVIMGNSLGIFPVSVRARGGNWIAVGGAEAPPTAGFEAVTGSAAKVELRSFNLTREDRMTENSLPLADLLAKTGDPDFLRQAAETVVQMLMEADVEGKIDAGTNALASVSPIVTATASAVSIHAWANHICAFQNCARAATSRPSWRPAKPARKPSWR